jgi:AcrR family transcriptional regulator
MKDDEDETMPPVTDEYQYTQAALGPPSNFEIERERDSTRREILAAMQRILLGHPKYVPPGATSVSQLAKEAKLGRHHLYQKHPDLRYRYEYLRDRRGQPTERETELQLLLDRTKSEIVEMRGLQSRTRQEANDWKALSELLARAINTLQEGLHQEQVKAGRLARRLGKLEGQEGQSSTVVLLHRRSSAETEPG